MKTIKTNFAKKENDQLKKLHNIFADALKEEQLIVENLLNPPHEVISKGEQLSDKVASFGGSWRFIIYFGIVLSIWILFNSLSSTKNSFDPYPFILMNLILSCIAALQAPIIMMSQNRKEEKDRKRAENDYLINLKAEIEIRNLHQKVNLLIEDQFKNLMDSQNAQIKLIKELHLKLDNQTNSAK